MRIFLVGLVVAVVLAVTGAAAYADGIGCGSDDTSNLKPEDMSVLPTVGDMPLRYDLSGLRDARRERRTRRRAAAAGMIAISGLGMAGVALARRRVRS